MSRRVAGLAGLLVLVAAGASEARPARCTTTDDGSYPCDFRPTDGKGSFEVTAPDKPTYTLVIEAPGRGAAFVNLGNRNISLAGPYARSRADPACWVSEAADARLCVR